MPRARRRLTRGAMFLILCFVVVVMLFPFVFMTLTAFRSYDQYLLGSGFSLDSWNLLFDAIPVVQQLINSTVVTTGAVALIVVAEQLLLSAADEASPR